MSRTFLIAILTVLSLLPMNANPRWKMHTTFDGEIDYIFDTPTYVYFTSRVMPDIGNQRRMSLFRYDKAGDELQSLSTDNVMTSSTVLLAQYCPQKGYVVVLNTNNDITFLYDDGTAVTMPDYRLANIDEEKMVNGITIDPWHNRVYLATNFGYVAVNDEKYEIAESRNYKEALQSVARIGNYLGLMTDSGLLLAKADSPRLTLSEYETMACGSLYDLAPLTENQCLAFTIEDNSPKILQLKDVGSSIDSQVLANDQCLTVSNNKNGVLGIAKSKIFQIESDGSITNYALPEDCYSQQIGSYDLSEVWTGKERKGIKSFKLNTNSSEWSLTRDYLQPIEPSPFATSVFAMHPSKGAFVTTYPYDYTFSNYKQTSPMLVSGYNDGWWTNYSPLYTNEERIPLMTMVNGIAVDPDNSNYLYVSTFLNGILRLNLNDAEDIIHMSKPGDKGNGQPGFVELVTNQTGKNAFSCNFSTPSFDNNGNMWTAYADYDNQNPPKIHLYCWEASDRKSTTSSSDIGLPKHLEYEYNYDITNMVTVLALRHSKNENRLLFSSRNHKSEIVLIDTKGTPTDVSDDTLIALEIFYDQDGKDISPNRIRTMWEDPLTGNVWVGYSSGLFYFNPDDLYKGEKIIVNRVKVSRNDGTNLADYLLDGATVNSITVDGNGRKWFSTIGGGLVCTSPDGRTIEEEINVSNSPLPSDDVYGALYLPSSNSMLISTSEGLAEYYLSGKAASSDNNDLKIYPNPVRPDYAGYVTIEGLPEHSLVKIVDASGNIVKEFGPVSGDVQWNVTNHQYKKVSSGVYFVLASSGENESSFATVGKILVVN